MNFKDYISGKRRGTEANKLEREAMNDPFLQDAMDGFDAMSGNHPSDMEALEKRLTEKPQRSYRRVWLGVAAAMIILLLGTQLFKWLQPETIVKEKVTASKTIETKESTPDAAEIPPLQQPLETKKDLKLIAQNKENPPTIVQEKNEPKLDKILIINDSTGNNLLSFNETEKETKSEIEALNIKAGEMNEAKENIFTEKESISSKGRLTDVSYGSTENNRNASAKVTLPTMSNYKTVKGKITDESGEPIIGVNVMVKNTTLGVVTNFNGEFELKVPRNLKDSTLTVSYIGMENKEIPVKENVGEIKMRQTDLAMNEVVVVGYGGTSRKITAFNENEFKHYFKSINQKDICPGQTDIISVSFRINENGKPENVRIINSSCKALEEKLKQALNTSPRWTKTNRNVTMTIISD